MKFLSYIIAILLFFSPMIGAENNRTANVFNLNGQRVELSDRLLMQLREKWKGGVSHITTSSLLTESDVRWILDYIAIIETTNSEGCDSYQITKTRNFDPHTDVDPAPTPIEPGLFDYVWEIDVCKAHRNYRVLLQKGDTSVTVYPLNL